MDDLSKCAGGFCFSRSRELMPLCILLCVLGKQNDECNGGIR